MGKGNREIIILIIIIYSLVFIYSFTFLAPVNTYKVLIENPSKGLIGIVELLGFNPQSDSLLIRSGSPSGPVIDFIRNNKVLSYKLGTARAIAGCVGENSGEVAIFDLGKIEILVITNNSVIMELGFERLPPSRAFLACNKIYTYMVLSGYNETTVYIIDRERGQALEFKIPGKPVDAKVEQNSLFILSNLNGAVLYGIQPQLNTLFIYNLTSIMVKPLKIAGDGIITGYMGNYTVVTDLKYNVSLFLEYKSGRTPVEAVVRKNSGYLLLARPPGDWLHILYVSPYGHSEVEAFYTYSYSFLKAGAYDDEIWVAGIIYNGSIENITILKTKGAIRGLIGTSRTTVLIAGVPGETSQIVYKQGVKYHYEKVKITGKKLEMNYKKVKLEEKTGNTKLFKEYLDYPSKLITSIIIITIVDSLIYFSIRRSDQRKI